MESETDTAMAMIAEFLMGVAFREGELPTYQFRITDEESKEHVWTWHPLKGLRRDAAAEPTCVVEVMTSALTELFAGLADPMTMLGEGRIRIGGLGDDIMALGRLLVPPDHADELQTAFSTPAASIDQKRAIAMEAEKLMEKNVGHVPERLRRMLSMWIDHIIDHCLLDHWVRVCVPDLEVRPWVTPDESVVAMCHDAHEELRKEAQKFVSGDVKAPHYGQSMEKGEEPTAGRPRGFRHWNLVENFEIVPDNASPFPAASRLTSKICEKWTVMMAGFLVLEPGAIVDTHADASGWALSYHYGLIVPEKCYLKVAGETRFQGERRALLFNDSFIHSAGNLSKQTRVVFNVVCGNPSLNDAERGCLRDIAKLLPAGSLAYVK
jgi:hypothetical protein